MSDGGASASMVIAVKAQEQFEMYFVGLTFTLLAAAVPTVRSNTPMLLLIPEWTGWGLLFVSGLCGMWRLERRPHYYRLLSEQNSREALNTELKKAHHSGQIGAVVYLGDDKTLTLEQSIAKQAVDIATLEKELDRRDSHQVRVYRWQRICFVCGVLAILVARAATGALAH
jgi:hypothetical protein